MNLNRLLLSFILIAGLAMNTSAQQQPNHSDEKGIVTSVKANLAWYDLQKQSAPVLQGQGWSDEQKGTYGRLPTRAKEKVRPAIWSLSEQCAGISVRFVTNAAEIKVLYQVSEKLSFPHMSATGVTGLDLYTIDEKGKKLWSAGGNPSGDTIKYSFNKLNSFNESSKKREYQLFLPLYNHVKWMEIGLPQDAELSWIAFPGSTSSCLWDLNCTGGLCLTPRDGLDRNSEPGAPLSTAQLRIFGEWITRKGGA